MMKVFFFNQNSKAQKKQQKRELEEQYVRNFNQNENHKKENSQMVIKIEIYYECDCNF